MTPTIDPAMAARCRENAARFHRFLRARHAADGCPTWERYTYRFRSTVSGQPVEGWGCREHDIFTTAEA